MATGLEFTDSVTPVARAFDFPADDEAASSPLAAKLPRRLRRRLSAEPKAPSTVEKIETKLKEADLRRQATVRRQKDLRLRSSKNTFVQARDKGMHEHGDLLSRTLARCWRRFAKSKKTTFALAKTYEALEINVKTVKGMSHEDLVTHGDSACRALLERLEKCLLLSRASGKTSHVESVYHLFETFIHPDSGQC